MSQAVYTGPIAQDQSAQADQTPQNGNDQRTRRAFLTAAGAAGIAYVAALGYPVYRYLASPSEMALSAAAVTEVTLKDAQKLPAGSVLMFKFGPAPAMLIHHLDGRWIALSAVCTHLGCTVQYEPGPDRIHCACHGGVYNAYTGANVSGPPPKPLKLFKVAVNPTGVDVSRA
jgi:cytochrome b6-f complex iron-sulfur subunit